MSPSRKITNPNCPNTSSKPKPPRKRELGAYTTDSIDWACHVNIKDAENAHEMKNLVKAYKETEFEVLGELEEEYSKLRKPPRKHV
jgi:hypothetical protein